MPVLEREEILHRLKSSHQLSNMDDTQNWRDAFDAYNVSHGTKLRAKDRCNKCFQKVLDWVTGVEK